MCLTRSNILELLAFLDRIAICEIIIKIKYFYSQNYKSFIYKNLLKTRFFSYAKNLVCVPKLTLPFNNNNTSNVRIDYNYVCVAFAEILFTLC